MTLLSKNLFIQEPKPREEDFTRYAWTEEKKEHHIFYSARYKLALKEHKERTEEPEPDWIRFDDETPPEFLLLYMSPKPNSGIPPYTGYRRHVASPHSFWYDKKTHDLKLKKYQDNRVRYKGWKHSSLLEDGVMFTKNGVTIYFLLNEGVKVFGHNFNYSNSDGMTPEQFESITGIKPD